MPPTPLVLSPSGFLFVEERLPGAPVMSLRLFPYSRTMSPQVRDWFAMLWDVSHASLHLKPLSTREDRER
jgi:hypothetical protein